MEAALGQRVAVLVSARRSADSPARAVAVAAVVLVSCALFLLPAVIGAFVLVGAIR